MHKRCKCTNCDAEMVCPMHCEKHMEEKEGGMMHCTVCGHMEEKKKCEHCGGDMEMEDMPEEDAAEQA